MRTKSCLLISCSSLATGLMISTRCQKYSQMIATSQKSMLKTRSQTLLAMTLLCWIKIETGQLHCNSHRTRSNPKLLKVVGSQQEDFGQKSRVLSYLISLHLLGPIRNLRQTYLPQPIQTPETKTQILLRCVRKLIHLLKCSMSSNLRVVAVSMSLRVRTQVGSNKFLWETLWTKTAIT